MATLPPAAQALLETIAGPESRGRYNVIYGGSTFNDFADHPRQAVEITSGPNKGRTSSAAGKFQILGSTYDRYASAAGVTDFSPESQDRVAWAIAQDVYRNKTRGRDLLTDLNAGDLSRIPKALHSTWTSMPGGIEQGIGQGAFDKAYKANYAKFSGADIASRIRPRADLEALRQGMSPVGKMPMRQELGAFVTPKPETMSPGMREKAGAAQSIKTAAGNAWDGAASPPLPRRRPDNNPRPPAFIPTPPVPFDMPPRIQQARTGDYPPLPSPAPLVNPMAYGQPNQSAQITPATVPMYRENWSDSLDMSNARPSLSAMTAAQNVARGAANAYQSVAGRPQTVPVTIEFVSDTQPPDPRMDVERLKSVPRNNGWAAQYGIDNAAQQAWKTGEAAPQPKEMSPALRAARERLQAARDARQGAQTSWFDTRRTAEPKSGTMATTRTDFGFEPVPQGGRPNIDIPGEATTIKWGQAIPRAEPPAPPPPPPPKPLVAPQPMPRPADRMPAQPSAAPPQGQNWMDAAAAGIPRMMEQVNAAMPKGNAEPTWFEQQTGNRGSRGPTALQVLGMINTNRLMNSLSSAPTISTTYRRRDVEPVGYPSPTDWAEYSRVANALSAMPRSQPNTLSAVTREVMANGIPWWQQDNPGQNSISSPTGSPFWSYN